MSNKDGFYTMHPQVLAEAACTTSIKKIVSSKEGGT